MKDYTILIPNMAKIHFSLLKSVFKCHGFNVVVLNNESDSVVQQGLKYVHNDTCYPALLVIGQMIDALNSGQYDINKTALMITQTGGGCRASNYIHLLRKALKQAGYENVPVLSFNLSGLEKNSSVKISISMLRQALAGLMYADVLMLLSNQVRPYEQRKGESNELINFYIEQISGQFRKRKGYSSKEIKHNLKHIVNAFSKINVIAKEKIKVGVVGEIYVKYASLGNNNLEGFLAEENCEVMVPGLFNFVMFKIDNRLEDIKLYGGSKIKEFFVKQIMNYLFKFEKLMLEAISEVKKFKAPSPYLHLKSLVKDVIGYGNKMGEGWLLTAEMIELITLGYENIVCTQPFGCLPNHIVGKGMIRKIKSIYENANIVPIDYDPGATKVNQENRIKLMLAVAKESKQKDINVAVFGLV